jgi:hypothetical protein
MMGSAKAHYEGHQGLLGDRSDGRSESDHGADARQCRATTTRSYPYKDASLLQAKLLKNGTLKVYPGYPHGMCTTNADVINSRTCSLSYGRDHRCRAGVSRFGIRATGRQPIVIPMSPGFEDAHSKRAADARL